MSLRSSAGVSVCLCVCINGPYSHQVFHLLFHLQGIPLLCFSPITDTDEEGQETHLCQATGLRSCLPLPGISILDKLIKTCPVWLQLNMNQERARTILGKETAGVSPKWFRFRQPHFLTLVEPVRRAVLFFMWKEKCLAEYAPCFH
ncbi:ras and rab interactor 3 [Limosa lapponica baueri]|uniref:Ras and rab interactor 3 n=1 Tax=Limosa lapponica baueri TaxID=1758121 RepID=A0A2I0U0P4_LIMLA|nr:ras and rab interactor 3 [Limosa lapponica baueri]